MKNSSKTFIKICWNTQFQLYYLKNFGVGANAPNGRPPWLRSWSWLCLALVLPN